MRRVRKLPFDKWVNTLLYLAIGGFIALIVCQVLLMKEVPRNYLSRVDKLEGESILLEMPQYATSHLTVTDNTPAARNLIWLRPSKTLTIRMVTPGYSADVYATVNGQPVADFKKGEVVLKVFEGDYIEIDSSRLKENARFVVKTENSGVLSPVDGEMLEGYGGLIEVGQVKYKH